MYDALYVIEYHSGLTPFGAYIYQSTTPEKTSITKRAKTPTSAPKTAFFLVPWKMPERPSAPNARM